MQKWVEDDVDGVLQKEVAYQLIFQKIVSFARGETVTFSSGIRSPGCYIDFRLLPSFPELWDEVIRLAAWGVLLRKGKIDAIAGVETAGISHGAALAWESKLPFVFVRKNKKGHGMQRMIEGDPSVYKSKRVLLVDDMGSTGGSSLSAPLQVLREHGAVVEDMLYLSAYGFPELTECAIRENVNVHCLITYPEILAAAQEVGRVDSEYASLVQQWILDPRKDWTWN